MRIVILGIILGIITVIPFGVWVYLGIFSIWLFYKLKSLECIKFEIVQKNQYDDEILDEMK